MLWVLGRHSLDCLFLFRRNLLWPEKLTVSWLGDFLLFCDHSDYAKVFVAVYAFSTDVVISKLVEAVVGISIFKFKQVNHVSVITSQIYMIAASFLFDWRGSKGCLVEYEFFRAALGVHQVHSVESLHRVQAVDFDFIFNQSDRTYCIWEDVLADFLFLLTISGN